LDIDEKIDLVLRNTEEIVNRKEMKNLLETTRRPKAYWGFECSGFMHVGIGLIPGLKIKDMVKAGFEFTIFLADWHSWINNKLGGNMDNIRICGEYFKHCFKALGVASSNTNFVWTSNIAKDIEYWEKVVLIAKASSLGRVRRALTIMGREMELSNIDAAWIFYPCMQAADIFHMNIDVACGGIDQRKAHMLARDVADKMVSAKPICVHTSLLSGLQKPEFKQSFDEDLVLSHKISSKMSKSKPESCIFLHDPPEKIRSKMRGAYCPPGEEKGNSVLEHARFIIFPELGTLEVTRPVKYGGSVIFESYESLLKSYYNRELHPLDLKNAVAEALVKILKPVREYFKSSPEPLEKLVKIDITR
jgi:tyrosyl-tRNA synthetase